MSDNQAASAAAPSPAPEATPAPAAPVAAPAAPSAPSSSPAPVSAEPSAPSAPAGEPQQPASVINTMPQRGTQEYLDAFDKLSYEQKIQLEKEIISGVQQVAAPEVELPSGNEPLPGDDENTDPEYFIDEQEVEAMRKSLPPEMQSVLDRHLATVNKMQETIDTAKDFLDPNTQKGIDILMSDPIIAARIKERNEGKAFRSDILQAMDVEVEIDAMDMQDFSDLDPSIEEDRVILKERLKDIAKNAYERGANKAAMESKLIFEQQLAVQERVNDFKQKLSDLSDKHPELKATETGVSFSSPNHPMNPFVKFAADLGDEVVMKIGMEAAYAAFLAKNGSLQNTIKNVQKNTILNFVKKMNQVTTGVRTVQSLQSPQVNSNQAIPGVDLNRYGSDPLYARQIFTSADEDTRLKLEKYRATGSLQ